MHALITKSFTFEAAHHLPNHRAPDGSPGKCSQPHGHSYVLIVTLRGNIQTATPDHTSFGFVTDFAHVGAIVKKEIIDRVDHRDLNEVLPFRTTAELMAFFFFGLLDSRHLPVFSVELFETATSSAIVTTDEFDEREYLAMQKGVYRCVENSP